MKICLEDITISYLIGFVVSCLLLAIGICFKLFLFGNQEVTVEESVFVLFLLFFLTFIFGTALLIKKR